MKKHSKEQLVRELLASFCVHESSLNYVGWCNAIENCLENSLWSLILQSQNRESKNFASLFSTVELKLLTKIVFPSLLKMILAH